MCALCAGNRSVPIWPNPDLGSKEGLHVVPVQGLPQGGSRRVLGLGEPRHKILRWKFILAFAHLSRGSQTPTGKFTILPEGLVLGAGRCFQRRLRKGLETFTRTVTTGILRIYKPL